MENFIVESIDKTNNPDKFALFIGRWQPFHDGHQWLIDQKLKHGKRVCIAIRDVPKDDKNWWSSEEIQEMLEERFLDEIYKGQIRVIIIPDIESINIGRGVGYDIIEHIPPQDIHDISATKVREELKKNDNNGWKVG
jgi:cytidyltransferase-like protein